MRAGEAHAGGGDCVEGWYTYGGWEQRLARLTSTMRYTHKQASAAKVYLGYFGVRGGEEQRRENVLASDVCVREELIVRRKLGAMEGEQAGAVARRA